MLRRTASVIAISAAFTAAACNDTKTAETTPMTTTAPPPAVKPAGDSQALTVITAVNQGEVDQANAALPKLAHDDAKSFATMMLKEHSEALAKLSAIATEQKLMTTDNATVTSLKAENARLVGDMSTATAGPAFDRTYMQAQVEGHTKALRLIDNDLLPNTTNAALKDCLTEMRGHVQEHLAKAQGILQTMPST